MSDPTPPKSAPKATPKLPAKPAPAAAAAAAAPPPPPPPMPADGLELGPGVKVPESAVRVAFSRSSGPGGQNVNKVNSKAEVWVRLDAIAGLHPDAMARLKALAGRRVTDAGELHLVAEASRSQHQNREDALSRVRQLVVEAMVRPKPRRATKPSRRAKQRRLDAKKRRSDVKSGRRAGGGD
jgi:ribosome-associated protein